MLYHHDWIDIIGKSSFFLNPFKLRTSKLCSIYRICGIFPWSWEHMSSLSDAYSSFSDLIWVAIRIATFIESAPTTRHPYPHILTQLFHTKPLLFVCKRISSGTFLSGGVFLARKFEDNFFRRVPLPYLMFKLSTKKILCPRVTYFICFIICMHVSRMQVGAENM